MRPEDPEQEAVQRICVQPQLPLPLHAEAGLPLLYLWHDGHPAPRTRQAGVRAL